MCVGCRIPCERLWFYKTRTHTNKNWWKCHHFHRYQGLGSYTKIKSEDHQRYYSSSSSIIIIPKFMAIHSTVFEIFHSKPPMSASVGRAKLCMLHLWWRSLYSSRTSWYWNELIWWLSITSEPSTVGGLCYWPTEQIHMPKVTKFWTLREGGVQIYFTSESTHWGDSTKCYILVWNVAVIRLWDSSSFHQLSQTSNHLFIHILGQRQKWLVNLNYIWSENYNHYSNSGFSGLFCLFSFVFFQLCLLSWAASFHPLSLLPPIIS